MSMMNEMPGGRRKLFRRLRKIPLPVWLIAFGLLGGIVGLGGYTFVYAQGTAYLGDDPAACANCHVMRDVYTAWNHGSHKAFAGCNDCHVPHSSIVAKYAVKGIDGVRHSFAFTAGNFPDNIRITQMNYDIAKDNCLRCHGNLVTMISHEASSSPTDCLHCHANVGHEP